jgi:ketosteroid isomerase-like protein
VNADDDVREANNAFYAAFEARDLDAMSEVWEHSDRISVTHPGWPRLDGWARVAASWETIFAHTPYIQFVLTDEVISVGDGMAWVSVDENILQTGGPGDGSEDVELSGASVAATNVFVHDGDRWRMVVHHGSGVQTPVQP